MKPAPLRIICVGNRLLQEDAAGPEVFERLREKELPAHLAVIDGGLGGLDLLRHLEGARRVVFVDAATGFHEQGGLVVLEPQEAGARAEPIFGHASGLAYLLRIAPAILEDALPEIIVVGLEGAPTPTLIDEAVATSLQLALHGAPAASLLPPD